MENPKEQAHKLGRSIVAIDPNDSSSFVVGLELIRLSEIGDPLYGYVYLHFSSRKEALEALEGVVKMVKRSRVT